MALGVVVAAPLALGAVHLATTLGLAFAGCLALALLVVARRRTGLRAGWLSLALVGCVAAIAFQLLPLPPALLHLLAPESADIFGGILGPTGRYPAWRPISLDLPATARELARAAGLLAVFLVLVHRAIESRRARRRALAAIASAGSVVAALGVGHVLLGATSLLGVWSWSSRPPLLSTFGNPNHLAGSLNIAALVALGLAASAERSRSRIGWGLAFIACGAGTVLSASRGGLLALGVGLAFVVALGFRSEQRAASTAGEPQPTASWRGWMTAGVAAAVALAIAAWIYMENPTLAREIGTLGSINERDGKILAFRTAVAAIRSSWLVGIGRGAFESAHPRFLPEPAFVSFTHAENEPLQLLAELGVPVGLAVLAAVVVAWLGLARKGRRSWAEAGAAAGALALLLQNLGDFSLEFAAGLALVALLAHPPTRGGFELRLPGRIGLALAALAVTAVFVALPIAWPGLRADTEGLVSLGADPSADLPSVEAAAAKALDRRPGDYLPCELVATRALRDKGGAPRALPWINRMLSLNPQSGAGHVLAAETLARLGRKAQALLEYRTAAELGVPTMARVLQRYPDRDSVLAAAPVSPTPAAVASERLFLSRRLPEAIEVAERVDRLAPGGSGIAQYLHLYYTTEGRHEDARAAVAELRRTAPKNGQAWTLEASSLAALGRPVEARALLEQAVGALRDDPAPVLGLATFELGQGRPDGALAALGRLPASASASARVAAYSLRARAHRVKHQDERARDELRLALRLQPDDAGLRLELAEVYLALGRLDEAEGELVPLADAPSARPLRDRIAARRRELSEAERLLRRGEAPRSPP